MVQEGWGSKGRGTIQIVKDSRALDTRDNDVADALGSDPFVTQQPGEG